MMKIDLQLLGGRGASAFASGSNRTLADMLGPGRRGKPEVVDASQYGGMLAAEAMIRDLSRERALIYDDIGERPVASFQGTRDSVMIPNERIAPNLTHNHPDRRFGGTFSPADVNTATTQGLTRIRAAAKEGSYYLNATSKARPDAFNRAMARALPGIERNARSQAAKIVDRVQKGALTWKKANAMQRTVIVGEYHKWYKENASKYGYTYGRQKLNTTRR